MEINDRFKNKVAVVTGGATGIGRAIASRLGKEGAILAIFDVNEALLQETVAGFIKTGIRAKGFPVDISDESQVTRSVNEAGAEYGQIDILVNAAGIVGPTSTNITEYPVEDFDKIYQVNLRGSFLITKSVLVIMKRAGKGRILLISSIAGKEGNPGMVGYSSTKAGVIGLVKAVAKEYADMGISINGLAPAVIKTAMNDNTSLAQMEYMISKIPMKRLGTVEEVAAISCYIVSDENSFSTGFIYDISDGRATY